MEKKHYDILYETEIGNWWYRVRRKIIHDIIKKQYPSQKQNLTILDIGCGTGALLKEIGVYGECHGLDFSQKAVDFCKKRGISNVGVGDVVKISYPNNTFDIVLALDIIEHVEDDQKAISEIHRVLKPGGIAIVTAPAFMFLWGITDKISHHYRRYILSELQSKINKQGFSVVRASYFNTFLFFPVALVRLIVRLLHIPMRTENGTGKGALNFIFFIIFYAESILFKYINFPFGVSVVTICRK